MRRAALLLLLCATASGAPAARAASGDPLLARQRALHDLGADDAWRQATGEGVTVAVLDTGADLSHPDLAPNLWTNPGEIAGNGRDDDGDGIVDDVHGADLVDGDGDPSDTDGHGTRVAGVIAARSDDGVGIAGVAPRARLMVVRVLDDHHNGVTGTLARGIRYAVAHGAQIVNVSSNGDGRSDELEDAVRAAQAAGVTIVASAGNDGRNLDLAPSYPASYPEEAVVAVGATEPDGTRAPFSNFGSGVDVLAPGDDVLTTVSGGGWEPAAGTSIAAPAVSGALALVLSAAPGISAADARSAVLQGSRRVLGLAPGLVAGSLDLVGALRRVVAADRWNAPPPQKRTLPTVSLAVEAHRRPGRLHVSWRTAGDASAVAVLRVVADGDAQTVEPTATALTLRLAAGRHVIRVDALDATGETVASDEASVSLKAPKAKAAEAKRRPRARRAR